MVTLAIEYIVSEPEMFSGRPHIAGRRIGIDHIASYYNGGWSVETICNELDLTPGEVHAALSYYFDHKAEIDEQMRVADEHVRQAATSFDELRTRIEQCRANQDIGHTES